MEQLLELARDAEAKQNASVGQDLFLNDLDREVLEGVVKRFEVSTDDSVEGHNDDQPA